MGSGAIEAGSREVGGPAIPAATFASSYFEETIGIARGEVGWAAGEAVAPDEVLPAPALPWLSDPVSAAAPPFGTQGVDDLSFEWHVPDPPGAESRPGAVPQIWDGVGDEQLVVSLSDAPDQTERFGHLGLEAFEPDAPPPPPPGFQVGAPPLPPPPPTGFQVGAPVPPPPPFSFQADATSVPPPSPVGFQVDAPSAPPPPPAGFQVDAPPPPAAFLSDAPPPPVGFQADAPPPDFPVAGMPAAPTAPLAGIPLHAAFGPGVEPPPPPPGYTIVRPARPSRSPWARGDFDATAIFEAQRPDDTIAIDQNGSVDPGDQTDGDGEDLQTPAITPDFFARAGWRRR